MIILLDTSPLKRKYRITKRWIFQNLKLEKCNYAPTIKMLFRMYKWSNNFEKAFIYEGNYIFQEIFDSVK